ncbi:hypothetical protein [Rhodococcus sp. Leaf233]|uniref:hypothetical protein n=1 Tax=Rhodococcus sp. Leaf233 TaxID=1736302 RepID=UPI00070CA147|nr:hypothetical protein [Rhodococcus sp. Leaf233]KQU35792.1 hypothetical protein ASH04_24270 [Rhodococcus sp. Leaf233]
MNDKRFYPADGARERSPHHPRDLRYEPNTVGIDSGDYRLDERGGFAEDWVSAATMADLPSLAQSPDWEDRLRAEILRQRTRITLPEAFPCIYEVAESPTKAKALHPRPQPWVVSPDEGMLAELLPLYQELWDHQTRQWGPGSRRVFALGHLDGLSPRRVYRRGTTVAQVIGGTMLVHTDLYRTAPEHLRALHPMHEVWAGRSRPA